MRWIDDVACTGCLNMANTWSVVDSTWTCDCGRPVTQVAIKAMQKLQDRGLYIAWLDAEAEWLRTQVAL